MNGVKQIKFRGLLVQIYPKLICFVKCISRQLLFPTPRSVPSQPKFKQTQYEVIF